MNVKELEQAVWQFMGKTYEWHDGSMCIATSDGAWIHLEYSPEDGEVHLYCQVAAISVERFGAIAVNLLQANLFGEETGGHAVLAYDREQQQVILWDKFVLSHLSESEFRERFSLLYLSRLYWSKKIRDEVPGGQMDAFAAYIGG